MLRPGLAIDVYDSSPMMLDIVQERAGDLIENVLRTAEEIRSNEYDVVILSMVLVCISDAREYSSVLTHCRRALKSGGILIVAVTHPCFRANRFSNFSTSYSEGESFDYLSEGAPFTVTIKDASPPSVSFVDFHWSLGFTLNAIAHVGLRLVSTIETKDDPVHTSASRLASPYLILTCIKDET
jgi:SAM-dependent methyltransferase